MLRSSMCVTECAFSHSWDPCMKLMPLPKSAVNTVSVKKTTVNTPGSSSLSPTLTLLKLAVSGGRTACPSHPHPTAPSFLAKHSGKLLSLALAPQADSVPLDLSTWIVLSVSLRLCHKWFLSLSLPLPPQEYFYPRYQGKSQSLLSCLPQSWGYQLHAADNSIPKRRCSFETTQTKLPEQGHKLLFLSFMPQFYFIGG